MGRKTWRGGGEIWCLVKFALVNFTLGPRDPQRGPEEVLWGPPGFHRRPSLKATEVARIL